MLDSFVVTFACLGPSSLLADLVSSQRSRRGALLLIIIARLSRFLAIYSVGLSSGRRRSRSSRPWARCLCFLASSPGSNCLGLIGCYEAPESIFAELAAVPRPNQSFPSFSAWQGCYPPGKHRYQAATAFDLLVFKLMIRAWASVCWGQSARGRRVCEWSRCHCRPTDSSWTTPSWIFGRLPSKTCASLSPILT